MSYSVDLHEGWSEFPDLLKELDLHKNQSLTFKGKTVNVISLSPKTKNRIDWICGSCSHEWSATGSERTNRGGTGCPSCSGRILHSSGLNSMAVTHPELAKEFQGDATMLRAGTKKKLPWKCSKCEHIWSAVGTSRVSGGGCPACAGNVIHSDGRNSMAMTHPKLAKEYQGDATKIKSGTKKKLPWKCSVCEHEWMAVCATRAKGVGCPCCSGRSVHSDGRNSMTSTNPELAIEFIGNPDKVKANAWKKYSWKCKKCKHEWKAEGIKRVRGQKGCPKCSKKSSRKPRRSLAENYPDLAVEYQGDATKVYGNTTEKLLWKCNECSNLWHATGHSRVGGTGCPACAGQKIHSDGRNSMAVTHPELAKELIGDPTKVTSRTSSYYDWRCSTCGHEWRNKAGNRSLLGQGCPACNNQAIKPDGSNSLAKTHPNLAVEYIGDSTKILAGTGKKLQWKCSTCSHEYEATGGHRLSGTGCPACVNQSLHNDGRNSMAITHPDLLDEYDGDGYIILATTSEKLNWTCITCSHKWKMSGRARVQGGGCPACINKEIHIDGRNSMALTHPHLADEFQGDAKIVIAGTNKRLGWKCKLCKHEWKATGSDRVVGTGCPACSNKQLHIFGHNSLATMHPLISKEYIGDASKVISSTLKKLDWKCSVCSHQWPATGHHRTIRGQGCPACAKTGFQPHLPAYYYVNEIYNQLGDTVYYKGGISNNIDERLRKISQSLPEHLSIKNVASIYFDVGDKAKQLEIELLGVERIRAPQRDFDGGSELFISNPLEYANENGLLLKYGIDSF
jgi:Zn finger protein HypA/HybF involved in hydrogenase expression